MKLTRIARLAIKGSDDGVQRLADILNVSKQSIRRYLNDENDDNLTKVAAIEVIKELTGLTQEEILEAESAEIVATTR